MMLGRAIGLSTSLFALLVGVTMASAKTQSHLEACTQWNVEKGMVGFWNKCGQPVVVNFTQLNAKQPTVHTISPGARFDTGLSPATLKSTGWMSTRCAVGYSPNLPFKLKSQKKIIASQYKCVKK
jgi:hypothetical protein